MKWILVIISLQETNIYVDTLDTLDTMIECFRAWEDINDQLIQPKINKQLVCIQTDKF